MTAAGDAVLAVAYGEVGYVEGPNNDTKYWSWYGGNYGPWCGVFCMWCSDRAGYPVCADTVLVSNGTVHGYSTGGSGATGVEAQTTPDLQPGDFVLFSWEPWEFRNGVPTCVGEWDGYPAGDHIGVFAYWVDQGAGRFAAVEGNTSDGSWDNGGMVLLREDRYTSQVCGWWRQENIAGAGSPTAPPKPTYNLTESGVFILFGPTGAMLCGAGYYKGLSEEEYQQLSAVPGMVVHSVGDNQRAVDVILSGCVNGMTAESDELRYVQRLRLIETMGGLHLTDGISTSHLQTPDDVQHAINLGWIPPDAPTLVPDTLGRSLIQEAGEQGSDDE